MFAQSASGAALALFLLLPFGHAAPLGNGHGHGKTDIAETLNFISNSSHPTAVCGPSDIRFKGITTNNVEHFLNIRYGEKTSGNNRFAAPNPFTYANGTTVNATSQGASCPQPKLSGEMTFFVGSANYTSEDCLNLRIARPAGHNASSTPAKLPVMVWIYGGGDSLGTIYDPNYDPTNLVRGSAEKGTPVIYVAMNYRLGFFGFAANAALNASDSLNAGLLDQRLALRWVREYISHFGGDPENVTIFGESDGATSVGLHVTAYGGRREKDEPQLFKRAIMQSGGPMADPGVAGNRTILRTAYLTKELNCSKSHFPSSSVNESKAELECLRRIPLSTLNAAVNKFETEIEGGGGMGSFISVAPSSFIPESPSKLIRDGNFTHNIDLIGGWNEDDEAIFVPSNITTDKEAAEFLQQKALAFTPRDIKRAFSFYPLSSFNASVKALPPVNRKSISPQYFRVAEMIRDMEFACPSIYFAEQMRKYSAKSSSEHDSHNKRNTTNYLFALNHTVYEKPFAFINASYYGVSHMSDIPYVFNHATNSSAKYAKFASSEDARLSSEMSGSWAAFASSGNASDGNGTVQGWVDIGDSGVRDRIHLQVIGGPDSGSKIISKGHATHGKKKKDEYGMDMWKKCEFWNSKRVMGLLQT